MKRINIYFKLLIVILGVIFICFLLDSNVYAKNVVVVIDPGHGGEAIGGNMDDRIERDINLITAKAMQDRLLQYDGVDVYLTRTNNEDKELTRKQRFEFAKYVDADFLFSIHYNMSENHTLFGSEVWVCSSGPFYQEGKSFATIEMDALTSLGLFDRGIKCKLASDGGEYYGILKYSREYSIPAVIIEHCHLDEERDSSFWNEDSYKRFGEIDADSVAKYFRLSSQSLNIDNSNFEKKEFADDNIEPDQNSPLYCNASLISSDDFKARISVSSKDNETYIQYYSYSLDNGNSWSRLEAWPDRTQETITFEIDLPEDREADLIVKTQDKYDNDIDSDLVKLPMAVKQEVKENNDVIYTDLYINPINDNDKAKKIFLNGNVILIAIIILVCATFIFVLGTIIWFIYKEAERKRRKKKKRNTNHET